MSLTLGTLTLSDGTRAQPYRITGGAGERTVALSAPIRGDAKVYDRRGRYFEETIEVSYSYATAALARAAWISRRNAVLAEPKAAYTDGSTTIGNALCKAVQLLYNDGCGITISYHLIGELI